MLTFILFSQVLDKEVIDKMSSDATGIGTANENDSASEEEEEEAHGFRVIQPCIQRQISAQHQSPVPSSVSSTLDDLFNCDVKFSVVWL